MIKKSFILSFLILFAGLSFGQNKQQLIEFAEKAYEIKNYNLAIYYYEELIERWNALSENPTIDYPNIITDYKYVKPKVNTSDTIVDAPKISPYVDVLVKLTDLCQLTKKYEKNLKYCNLLIESDTNNLVNNSRLKLGVALMNDNKFEEAIEQFTKFLDSGKGTELENKKAIQNMQGAEFAIKDSKKKLYDFSYYSDSSLNLGVNNFAVSFYDNENDIIYSSSSKTEITEKNPVIRYHSDLFKTSRNNDAYENISSFDSINTIGNEGAGIYIDEINSLLFTKWDAQGNKAIYISNSFDGKWLAPRKLGENINLEGYQSMQPNYDSQNKFLYFVSNRPGGLGGFDIWRCTIDNNGNPNTPENLGSTINTADNETTPFYHKSTNTLYFSSDGYVGMGGLDIYKSAWSKNKWNEPKNIGNPFNSGTDDSYFILNNDESVGYFCSDRNRCTDCYAGGCNNIYSFKYDIEIIVSGYVINSITDSVVKNASVRLVAKNDENLIPVEVLTNEQGWYSFKLKKDIKYKLEANKKDYYPSEDSISTMGIKKSTKLIQDIYLLKSSMEEIVLEGILYDFDKWDLLPKSKEILNVLVNIMNKYPKMEVELASHTDNRGNDNYNQILSQKRAESCVKYLINVGISAKRLQPVGYGESKPLIENAETEEDHQLNRRTTFRILNSF